VQKSSGTNHPSPAWFQTEESPNFDLKKFLFRYVIRYWWLFLVGLVVSMTIGLLYLRYTTPIYEVKSTLLIKAAEESGSSSLSEELVLQDLGLMGVNRNLENEIQILKSRQLMMQVVKELDLEVMYLMEGRVRITEAFPHAEVIVDSFKVKKPATFQVNILEDEKRFELQVGENVIGIPFLRRTDPE
jgi:tyrosine-protein kinase Etk/Wzc